MVRIYDYNQTYELRDDEPNIFKYEIIIIGDCEYRLIKREPWEFSNRNIGTHLDNNGWIAYVEDTRTSQLYVTILYDCNILLPIQNTGRAVGFRFDYHRWDNEEANERSLIRASQGIYQLPYYKVDVKFRGGYWFRFVSHWLSFPVVYCACKYFFDALYPEGYDSYDISIPVNFRAGANALNNIKDWFGKKSTRKRVTPAYCVKNYANKRDWEWSESVTREYGYNPLQEILGLR